MLIRILTTRDAAFDRQFAAVRERGATDDARVETQAREIVHAVRRRGDRAVIEFTRRFDGVTLTPKTLRVSEEEIARAVHAVPADAKAALRLAARRITTFHKKQVTKSWSFRDPIGLELGQQITPLDRVGLYVPGGHAAYPSSVLMNAIPARVAGVREVIMVSPCGKAGLNPAVLAAASIAGVDAVYQIGGAQAVAALAYGTGTVPRVDKIVGPGNAWVQAAKKLVYGTVDIDGVAGPSEVLVIADSTADPAFVAADLIAQAEHGSGDECAVLLTTSRPLALAVQAELARQLKLLPRHRDVERVLKRRGAIVVVRDMEEAVRLADEVAPEHLELIVDGARSWARRIRNAGAIFIGPFAPAPLGDYLAGPNHVLPTGGTARFFSPLGVYHFVKRTSVVTASRAALKKLAPSVAALATLEGYQAHARSVQIRFANETPARGGKNGAR